MKISNNLQKKSFIIIFLVSLFYVIIAFFSDFDKLVASFQNVQLIYLPLILLLVVTSIFLKSERQRFLLRIVSVNISVKDSFIIFNAGQSLLVTPGSVGNIIKSQFFKDRFGTPYSKTVPLILVERYYDMLGIISIISLFLIFRFDDVLVFPIIILTCFIFFVSFAIRNKTIFQKITNFLKRIPKLDKFADSVLESHNTISSFTSKKSLSLMWPYSIVCWIFDAMAVYFCFISFDLTFDFLDTTIISLTSLILGTLSFIPGGVGVMETSMIGFLLKYDIGLSVATALVMYVRLNTLWFSTILGFISTNFLKNEKSTNDSSPNS